MARRIEQVTGGNVSKNLWDEEIIEDPIDIPDMSIDEIMRKVKK